MYRKKKRRKFVRILRKNTASSVKNLRHINKKIRNLKRNHLHSRKKISESLEPYFQIKYYRLSNPDHPVTHRPKIFSHWKLYYNIDKIQSAEMNNEIIRLTEYPNTQKKNSCEEVEKLDCIGRYLLTRYSKIV